MKRMFFCTLAMVCTLGATPTLAQSVMDEGVKGPSDTMKQSLCESSSEGIIMGLRGTSEEHKSYLAMSRYDYNFWECGNIYSFRTFLKDQLGIDEQPTFCTELEGYINDLIDGGAAYNSYLQEVLKAKDAIACGNG